MGVPKYFLDLASFAVRYYFAIYMCVCRVCRQWPHNSIKIVGDLISLLLPFVFLCFVFNFYRENSEVQLFCHMCSPCTLCTHRRQNLIKICARAGLDLIRHSLTGSLEVEHLKLLIVKHWACLPATLVPIMGYVGVKRKTAAFLSLRIICLFHQFSFVLNMARPRIKSCVALFSISISCLILRQSIGRFDNDPPGIENIDESDLWWALLA